MEDYDSEQFLNAEDWGSRFPPDAIGSQELSGLPTSPEGNLQAWLTIRALRYLLTVPPPVPRLFVSHRRADRDWALRIANLACDAGFYFWLDVLNPVLSSSLSQNLPADQQALVTAVIIEMGLLNSSHVLALTTPNSPGSLWIPYEYGRVKNDVLFSTQAASWNHPKTSPSAQAEYLKLGADTYSESDIANWLTSELPGASARPWLHPLTTPLP